MEQTNSTLASNTECVAIEDAQTETHRAKESDGTDDHSKAVALPPYLHRLQIEVNTDLKQAPANWLRSGSKLENYLKHVHTSWGKGPPDFSSISMANLSVDRVDELDVISDAENIKDLLKMAYSNQPVSMMVHRVGKTLLLDDFDFHKHLLRRQQEEWTWLKKFYEESVAEKQKIVPKDRRKTIDHLQNRNMFSKFLYYSCKDQGDEEVSCLPTEVPIQLDQLTHDTQTNTQTKKRSDEFKRTFLWNFEDIHMLIGADLPIFGGETHPCVSLRLRDCSKPINVLTGLDYWLDNLMCNVPELAMCYHLNGIVQKYELMKTEDIPEMENAKFSPTVIKDVAQNILSFLKQNAAKEGHTYWLFKENNNDIVKLYDLTTLCADSMSETDQNPFTKPVGMLLYTVGRNMYKKLGHKKAHTIRTLLGNSLLLLNEDIDTEMVTSARMILANLLIGNSVFNTDIPSADDTSDDNDDDDDDNGEDDLEDKSLFDDENTEDQGLEGPLNAEPVVSVQDCDSHVQVSVKTLCKSPKLLYKHNIMSRIPPLSCDMEHRHNEAIDLIAKGLGCLDRSNCMKAEDSEPETISDHTVPIPLSFTPLSQCAQMTREIPHDSDTVKQEYFDISSAMHKNEVGAALSKLSEAKQDIWNVNVKTELLKMATMAYYNLVKINCDSQNYGKSLRYIKLALHCFDALTVLDLSPSHHKLQSSLMCLSGDVQVMLSSQSQNPSKVDILRNAFMFHTQQDDIIFRSAEKVLSSHKYEWVYNFTFKKEINLTYGLECYQSVEDHVTICTECHKNNLDLPQHMGNALNELGKFHTSKAADLLKSGSTSIKARVKELCHLAATYFNKGIEQFESFKDLANTALLISNIGRLRRIQAQLLVEYDSEGARGEVSMSERQCYMKAIEYYKKSLHILKSRKHYPDIWDSISWDASSTYFTLAILLQDHAPLSVQAEEKIEKEVIELLSRCLNHCDIGIASAHGIGQPALEYRVATVHHRLASLYHNSLRNQWPSSAKSKILRSLAVSSYKEAVDLYTSLDSPIDLLRVQLERVAMAELAYQGQTSTKSKMKTLEGALSIVLECRVPVISIVKQIEDENGDSDNLTMLVEEADKLISILLSRLQFVTLNLLRICSFVHKKNLEGIYKKMYAASLNGSKCSQNKDRTFVQYAQEVDNVLAEANYIYSECDKK